MLKDRGTMKWTSMMLAEHVQMLKQWDQDEQYIDMPDIAEWQLEDLQQNIEQAVSTQQEVEITIWVNGKKHSYFGVIKKVDLERQELHFETIAQTRRFSVISVIAVRLLDDCYD